MRRFSHRSCFTSWDQSLYARHCSGMYPVLVMDVEVHNRFGDTREIVGERP